MNKDRTYGQYVSLGIALTASSTLSIVGSSLIIFMALRDRSLVYHRILILLSAGDIGFSVFNAVHPYLVPADRTESPLAMGNDATCTMLGFSINAFPVYVAIYNAFLAVNFLLQIRYKWKNEDVARWVEPCVFVAAIVLSSAIPLVAVVQDKMALNYLSGFCLLGTYEETCEEVVALSGTDTNDSNSNSTIVANLECRPAAVQFDVLSIVISCILAVVGITGVTATVGLYRTVYSTYAANRRYQHPTTEGAHNPSLREQMSTRRPAASLRRISSPTETQQEVRLKRITQQCVLYGLAYANSFVWPFIFGVVDLTVNVQDKLGHPGIYMMVLLTYILMMGQGVLNFVIFIWPRYQKTKMTVNQRALGRPRTTILSAGSNHHGSGETGYESTEHTSSNVPDTIVPVYTWYGILYWTIMGQDGPVVAPYANQPTHNHSPGNHGSCPHSPQHHRGSQGA